MCIFQHICWFREPIPSCDFKFLLRWRVVRERGKCQVPSFMSSVGKSLRRDMKGKSDSVAGRGGSKGVSKGRGRFHYSTTGFFTMENYGKDSQGVKREGEKIYDDDTVGKLRGQLVDTQPMVGDGGFEVKN